MAMIYAYQNRAIAHDVTIYDVDGTAITPQDSDTVRLRVTQCGEEIFSLTSTADSANGSTIVPGNPTCISLDAQDVDWTPGTYSYVVEILDGASNDWKNVKRFVLHLEAE